MLSNGKRFPEVFKRISPPKFVPLQEIDWKKEYYLERFIHKLEKLPNRIKIKESQLKSLFLYNRDLRSIFLDIALIISRINEDGSKINRMEELYYISHTRRWTDSEAEEYENLRFVVNFFDLDVRSLLIHILIFMDKVAKFLSLFINKKGKKLKSRSFHRFKNDLTKLKGEKIQEFSQLVNDNTKWFNRVKDLRDDFIEHHPAVGGIIIFKNGEAYATLTTRKEIDREPRHVVMGSQAELIPTYEFDRIHFQLKRFLASLTDFLCSSIDILPIEVK